LVSKTERESRRANRFLLTGTGKLEGNQSHKGERKKGTLELQVEKGSKVSGPGDPRAVSRGKRGKDHGGRSVVKLEQFEWARKKRLRRWGEKVPKKVGIRKEERGNVSKKKWARGYVKDLGG